jgi:hypothetical protein
MSKLNKEAQTQDTGTKAPEAPRFKRTAAIVVPQLKMELEKSYFLNIKTPVEMGKHIEGQTDKDGKKKEPPMLARVIDLTTGEELDLIFNTVLLGNLNEAYPDNGYVGKSFEIIKHDKAEGKDYNTFGIFEVEASK